MTAAAGFDLSARHARLDLLISQAHQLLDAAVREHITEHRDGKGRGRRHAATVVLFSGGHDSTVLAHLFRSRATHAVHANTGIGIEATRQFVRDVCAAWGLPLIEKHPPPGSTYRELVLADGFPGPAKHWKMYQRLKERGLQTAKNELVRQPHQERIVFLAGRRLAESPRRTARAIPELERRKSIVWVSPLRNWTALDLNTYRMRFPECPRNQVADMLHMSGECLCGAFASRDEREQLAAWPIAAEALADIRVLEQDAAAAGIPEPLCRWGWGAGRVRTPTRSGPLCSSCASQRDV
ncbi:phosphoadenosine phosphosulfate reductase domain-containing protein [Jidongwangia harbinensis]|uniref:phosphoadenosine phosphosulfate reductase domain-containing protein n=1 Tax=Jidongwangia harbinensis TaxID=2878561 RepID=UPI001CD96A13|nr:phosphoadenosine phosphosulfate reductase family protein [Jidongwangia harbinensis]MCA2216351.1 phosphoadenosine phosphosulfate reductase family protein [Jidongwangia harbinensis]MCA2217086.1 phosphoadenosine phosphosulfate reductase family protein [Jidongwangia harbinensis]